MARVTPPGGTAGIAEVIVRTASRTDRVAAIVLAIEALLMSAVAALLVAGLPEPDPGEPATETALLMALWFNAIPAAATALIALVAGWLLWRGRRNGRGLALGWAAVAGVVSGLMLTSYGSVAWLARVVLFEPSRWQIRWPFFYYDPFVGSDVIGTPVERLPGVQLDSLLFWYPGLLFVGALAVAGLLLVGWLARRGSGSHVHAHA